MAFGKPSAELSKLRQEVAEIRGIVRLLELEVAEQTRKVSNALRSINRGGGKKADQAGNGEPGVPASPGLDPISQRILQRRAKQWRTPPQAKSSPEHNS